MRNNIRVCMVLAKYSPSIGGTERQAHKLSLALQREGCEPFVVTLRHNTAWPASAELDGIKIHRAPLLGGKWVNGQYMRGAGPVGFPLTLLNLVRHLLQLRNSYDILHVHQGLPHAAAALVAAKLTHKPILIKVANSGSRSDLKVLSQSYPGGNAMAYLISHWPDAIVALTPSIRSELRGQGIDDKRIHVIPNGVVAPSESSIAVGNHQFIRQQLGATPKWRIVLYLGSLQEKKGLDVLLQAWQGVAVSHPDAHLWIVGDGPQREMLTRKAAGMARVRIWGQTNNPDMYISACDLLVLPSRAEGLPNVLLEAMACGKPVIATAVGGVPDLMDTVGCGETVKPESDEDLADALKRWLSFPANQLADAGQRGRQSVKERYTLEQVAEKYSKLYSMLLT